MHETVIVLRRTLCLDCIVGRHRFGDHRLKIFPVQRQWADTGGRTDHHDISQNRIAQLNGLVGGM